MFRLRFLQHIPLLPVVIGFFFSLALAGTAQSPTASEAPAGFTTPSGCPLEPYPPGISTCSSNGLAEPAGDTFADDQETFEEQETLADGLGPIYNEKSCANCHQNPVTGGISQISELRVGHRDSFGRFVNPTIFINNGGNSVPSRSLVNDRAVCAQAQERVPGSETIRTFRTTTNTLGDGFVEAVDSNTLLAIANNQPSKSGGRIVGEFIQVPVSEAPGRVRGARFGWKNQHASLLSFAADAYLNEMGITSRFAPTDVTSVCKVTSDPEDQVDTTNGMSDIDHFAQLIRATNVLPREPPM